MREAVVGSPNELASVRISRKGAGRIESGHPWVFTSDVVERGGATAGSVVRVLDQRGSVRGPGAFERVVAEQWNVERAPEILKQK